MVMFYVLWRLLRLWHRLTRPRHLNHHIQIQRRRLGSTQAAPWARRSCAVLTPSSHGFSSDRRPHFWHVWRSPGPCKTARDEASSLVFPPCHCPSSAGAKTYVWTSRHLSAANMDVSPSVHSFSTPLRAAQSKGAVHYLRGNHIRRLCNPLDCPLNCNLTRPPLPLPL
ncbi:hypothetical protein LX32DRAFT_196000 [Colletotrichum zoysiae]|uniref:Uncharacterized protein n=1 Tax=Colletotrichum zoysiae TaxID=1216348 RepID=A0AAD9HQH9_9PEZI|nr:hypothetical protein LX32DRAFT_196000 [Colletotrichum zoysiae]